MAIGRQRNNTKTHHATDLMEGIYGGKRIIAKAFFEKALKERKKEEALIVGDIEGSLALMHMKTM